MVYNSMIEAIGKTPLIKLGSFCHKAEVYAKVERFNPTGSAKDRAALFMIEDAEKQGLLRAGGTIIEPTSGNTGIGLAAIACVKGYKVILTMPESMSIERRQLIAAYGAEIVLTEASKGMQGSVEKARELQKSIPNSIIIGQFDNLSNSKAHYMTTGPEIWEDTDGKADIFIAGIGTGGTVSGVGRYLKEQNLHIKVIGVEPASSPLLTAGYAGSHKIQGIGANFVPEVLDRSVLDEVRAISDEAAYEYAKMLARSEGLFCGISSGAALAAAHAEAQDPKNEGKTIVVLLPDAGERYLSAGVF